MAKKQVAAVVKIQIPAGQASPAPPVGTALGPHGVAIMDFCKDYNAKTEDKRGQIVPVEIIAGQQNSLSGRLIADGLKQPGPAGSATAQKEKAA